MRVPPAYAELHCLSNFTFLRGASHPQELVDRAVELGYRALALTDECSVAGVVRAHEAARGRPLQLIVGSEFRLDEGPKFVLIASNRCGYGQLCALITLARRRQEKGRYRLHLNDLLEQPLGDCLLLWLEGDEQSLLTVTEVFNGRLWLAMELFADGLQQQRRTLLEKTAARLNLPLVACGDVHMHRRGRRALQDTLTAIRLNQPLSSLGQRLFANGERHLRAPEELAHLYPAEALAETLRIAKRCQFELTELRYEYPHELIPSGHSPSSWLRHLTLTGAQRLYPQGMSIKTREQIEHELRLIAELNFEYFFLTVEDIVRWARSQGILCQGRGSAANSTVCYCLGITAVNPADQQFLFERFISRERGEPPDIDVDFEHERREEVIQYIYRKYGRDHAALAATVISYRPKSALRDVGKALGMAPDQIEALTQTLHWWDQPEELPERLQEVGMNPQAEVVRQWMHLVTELIGFPRHLSQHVGGFVISQGPVHELCPIENAAMAERTVIQWDKDDLESLGLLKVDVLALGMLTAIRKCFDLIEQWSGQGFSLDKVPGNDPATYAMIGKADTVGVFQIESRAQMSMLPRLQPQNLYDLTIQVAIVRPGPIQGDMVHPYLNRRRGEEAIDYPSEAVKNVLQRTLGVPIFQEQVMQLAIVAAGFSPGEADQLRRAMAAWKRKGGLEPFEKKLKNGMAQRGYNEDFADRIFNQIKGFGDYGFPESHAASFALLAYVSAWLKCHYPAAFAAALLNSQPMGFYAPAQLVADVRRHGVKVLPVDVLHSGLEARLEPDTETGPAIRLGLNQIKGLDTASAQRIVAWQAQLRHEDLSTAKAGKNALIRQANLSRDDMETLAAAGALASLSGNRHQAYWDAAGVEKPLPLLNRPEFDESRPLLPRPNEAQDIVADYASLGLSLKRHPLALLRHRLNALGVTPAAVFHQQPNGAPIVAAGLVISRQRPGSASGVIFMTLEDDTGFLNLVIWPKVLKQFPRPVLQARLALVYGHLQNDQGVIHLIAQRIEDRSEWLGRLVTQSRDFH